MWVALGRAMYDEWSMTALGWRIAFGWATALLGQKNNIQSRMDKTAKGELIFVRRQLSSHDIETPLKHGVSSVHPLFNISIHQPPKSLSTLHKPSPQTQQPPSQSLAYHSPPTSPQPSSPIDPFLESPSSQLHSTSSLATTTTPVYLTRPLTALNIQFHALDISGPEVSLGMNRGWRVWW